MTFLMENSQQNSVDPRNSLNKRTALIKFSFIQFFTYLHWHVFFFRNQSIAHFAPEENTMTGGLHSGCVRYLYKA